MDQSNLVTTKDKVQQAPQSTHKLHCIFLKYNVAYIIY